MWYLRYQPVAWLYDVLCTRRTHSLEAALAAEALVCGLVVLWPGDINWGPGSVLAVLPDLVLGGVLATHGIGAFMALAYGDVNMCRRSALVSAAIWAMLGTARALDPVGSKLLVPVAYVLAGSAMWVYLRLYVLYARPKQRPEKPAGA